MGWGLFIQAVSALNGISSSRRAARAQARQLKQQQALENRRQGQISAGQSAIENEFSKFDDDYYNSIADDYTDYATPQLEEQKNEAIRRLRANLARGGRLGSSVAAQEESKLSKTFSDELLNIATQGREYANNRRGAVNSAYGSLLSQNQGLADSSASAAAAQREAERLSVTPEYQPLNEALALASEFAVKRKAANTQFRDYNRSNPYSNYGIDKRPEETIYGG